MCCQKTPRLSLLLACCSCLAALTLAPAPMSGDDQRPAANPDVPAENPFPGRATAPSLEGGVEWFNCDGPISLRELRGKIVLLDFWTYCCINCIHVLPDLKYLEEKYPNELVVIGVHAAKFDNEKDSDNIREAILRYEISHPVVNDANMTIARKYGFNSWPTLVLIDPEGNFVGRQPGEGNRELFDMVIGRMIAWHRAQGTLDETPVRFNLEREKVAPTPLRYPGKILADAANQRLFISDSNYNRIVVTSLTGELLSVIGSGQIGRDDGSYAEATFDHPQGMCLVGDVLYVADTENHLIRKVDLVQQRVETLAGTGEQSRMRFARNDVTFPSGGPLRQTPLNSPWDLFHLNGVLYIAMAGPHQLWSHTLGSEVLEVLAGSGREDILDGPLAEAALAQPSGITSDGEFLYFVDSEGSAVRVASLGKNGTVKTLVGPHDLPRGRSLFEFADIDGTGDAVRLQHPIGLTYHNGQLFVADTYNHKIKLIDIKARTSTSWLGTGQRGRSLDPVELSEPAGLTVAGETLFIADTNNHRILAVDLATRATRELTIPGLQPPAPPQIKAVDESLEIPAQELAALTAKGNSLAVTVDFALPFEFKLNQLAPVTYRLKLVEGAQILADEGLGQKLKADSDGKQARFAIPLNGQPGTATVEVLLSYQYCKDGEGGVCRFANQRWLLPLTIDPAGQEQLLLIATP